MSDVTDLKAEVLLLRRENAELRKLARGLGWCSNDRYISHPESECPLYDENVEGKCRADELKRELGVIE